MNNYICVTHYHIWQSINDTLINKKPSRLIITAGYTAFDQELIANLKKLNIFEEVILFDTMLLIEEMPKKWHKNFKQADQMITKYEQFMQKHFGFIGKEESICMFSPRHWVNWYFYTKNYKIIKFEDGYCNFDAEMLNSSKTIQQDILELTYKVTKETILLDERYELVSSTTTNLKNNVRVQDFKLAFLNEEFVKVVKNIYSYLHIENIHGDVLFLSQPLFKNEKAAIKFIDLLADLFPLEKIIVKNHPANNYDFSKAKSKNIFPIKINFPMELMNFYESDISKIISISSTASDLLNIDCEYIKLVDNQKYSTAEIEALVHQWIKNKKIIIVNES